MIGTEPYSTKTLIINHMGFISTLFGPSKNKLNFSAPNYSVYPDLMHISQSDKDLVDRLTDMIDVYNKLLYKDLPRFSSIAPITQNSPSFTEQIILEYTLFVWSAATPYMKENNVSDVAGLSLYYSIKEATYRTLKAQVRESYYENFDKLILERNRYFLSLIKEESSIGQNRLLDYTAMIFAHPLQYVEIPESGQLPLTVKGMSMMERVIGGEILRSTLTTLPKEVARFVKG